MSQKILHYESSDDGLSPFAEIADVLAALSEQFEGKGAHYAAMYCATRAHEARKIEEVFQKEHKK